jgi:hypothetical protein
VPNQLIYTRRIAAPVAAAKMSGKVGDLNVGVLSAADDRTLSFDGSDNPLYNIVRLRRDLGAQSNAGVVYTDVIDGDYYNRVAGVDTRLLLGGTVCVHRPGCDELHVHPRGVLQLVAALRLHVSHAPAATGASTRSSRESTPSSRPAPASSRAPVSRASTSPRARRSIRRTARCRRTRSR